MKSIFFTTILISAFYSHSQLPTVYTSGGVKMVDWAKEKKKIELNEDENPFLYGSGCTEGPSIARASSTLSPQGNSDYKADNLFDWDPQTPWVEGKSDYGIGEYFQVDLPFSGSSVSIFNGYQKTYETWKNNSRVKKFKVYGDGRPLCYLILKDLMGYQTFNIPNDNDYDTYTFEIMEVYPGIKWKDVAISEICNIGCCFNINTSIQSNGKQLNSETLKKGTYVTTVDIQTETTSEHSISNVIEMKHSKLIRVTTLHDTIEITPYHPLFIKDCGFTSLLKLKKEQHLNSYEQLLDNLWVLMWNENEKKLKFEKIDNLELLFGEFTTYSILDIEQANTYIMNGFVSKISARKNTSKED
jgi:hypothetical protein